VLGSGWWPTSGLTENAEVEAVEHEGGSKIQGWKTREDVLWKAKYSVKVNFN